MQEPKLFVGNLDFKTTSEELRSLFAQAGEVVSVSLPTDRETGRPRGFAFVEYANDEQAEAAVQKFNGYELAGRPLRVNEAGAKPAGGGGGARSGAFGRDDRPAFAPRPKGSRRNVRARKRGF